MSIKSNKLAGKVAVVTGAGGGLGRAHAIELAQHGARVVVNDLGSSISGGQVSNGNMAEAVVEEIKGFGGEAIASLADVSDWDSSGRLIQSAIDHWGDLNILVNNAGIARRHLVKDLTQEDWDAVLGVHGTGHMSTTHFACRYWADKAEKTGGKVDGTMVHTVSRSATLGRERSVNYSFSKGGIIAMSLVAAHEMVKYGVTSNCISPTARTRVSEAFFGERDESQGYDKYDAENISPFVAFLATDEGREISGEIFEVRGEEKGVEIQRVRQAKPAELIQAEGRWEIDSLIENHRNLFEDGAIKPVAAPKEMWDK